MGFPTSLSVLGRGPTPDTFLPARRKERGQASAAGHGVFRTSTGHTVAKSPSCGNAPDASLKDRPGLSPLHEQGKVTMLGHP